MPLLQRWDRRMSSLRLTLASDGSPIRVHAPIEAVEEVFKPASDFFGPGLCARARVITTGGRSFLVHETPDKVEELMDQKMG